jgi:hypothetical protein
MNNNQDLYIELTDEEWPLTYTDHDRNIARGIVFDDDGNFYFVIFFAKGHQCIFATHRSVLLLKSLNTFSISSM